MMHEDVFETDLFDDVVLIAPIYFTSDKNTQKSIGDWIEVYCPYDKSIILALVQTPMTRESSSGGSMVLELRLYVLLRKLGTGLVLSHSVRRPTAYYVGFDARAKTNIEYYWPEAYFTL